MYDYKFFIEKRRYNTDGKQIMNCEEELEVEQQKYNDLVYLDLNYQQQGWFKLIYKVEQMIQWFDDQYSDQYLYFVKTDDDAVIVVPNLLDNLSERANQFLKESGNNGFEEYDGVCNPDTFLMKYYPLYAGYEYIDNPVYTFGDWNNSPFIESTLLNHYPRYMSGGMYILSNRLIKSLSLVTRNVQLNHWNMEDATLGFWLASFKLIYHHIDNSMTVGSEGTEYECTNDPFVAYHPVKEDGYMLKVWDSIKSDNYEQACKLVMENYPHYCNFIASQLEQKSNHFNDNIFRIDQ
jgi:hypothetical protein